MFYNKLQYACACKGISVTAFLAKIGMSSGNITNWQNGGKPRGNTLKAIADALDVPVEYFLDNDVKKESIAPKNDGFSKDLNVDEEIDYILLRLSPERKKSVLRYLRGQLAQEFLAEESEDTKD